ncbi:MAG: PadR family transcriptional regulator [Cytophagaceae bacterium]|nr:PadR family transcriptional regulator [Gemmatimonadaceae bacterium]
MADTEIDLLRSSLDLLILKALGWGPRHGVAVAEWIEGATKDALRLEEGTLYPALHRLERKGWLKSEWGMSDTHRRAKFYRLTATGRARFRAEAPAWQRFASAIAGALQAGAPDVAEA